MRTDQINLSSWAGYLTRENYREVAERVRQMLQGKRYTMVEMIHSSTPGSVLPPTLKAYTGLRMYPNWTEDAPGDPNDPIHAKDEDGICGFHVVGTRGFSVHTRKLDQAYEDMDAPVLALAPTWPTYVSFTGTIEIRFVDRAPAGGRVETVLAIENQDSSLHCPACGRDLWNLASHDCPFGTAEPLHVETAEFHQAHVDGDRAREAVR